MQQIYKCSECGAKVILKEDNTPIRFCTHTGGISAEMSAHAVGHGGAAIGIKNIIQDQIDLLNSNGNTKI